MAVLEQIDNMIKSNRLYRFESEMKDINSNDDGENIRVRYLRKIIDNIKDEISEKEINDKKMEKYFANLKHDVYKKRWQYLDDELKIDRIEKYCEENNMKDEIEDLIERVNNKKLKSKDVEYDYNNGILTGLKI
jgi:hypothetical protein